MARKEKPWVKILTSTRNDSKLKTLPMAYRWLWECLLLYAAEQPVRGTIERTPVVIAAETADGDVGLLMDCLRRLHSLELVMLKCNGDVIDSPITVHYQNFEKYQERITKSSKQRNKEAVARCRAKKKLSQKTSQHVIGNVPVMDGNVPALLIELDIKKEKTIQKEITSRLQQPTQIVSPDMSPPDPEIERVARWADSLDPMASWGPWVHRIAKMPYPAEWIESAIKSVMANRQKFNQRYLEGTLRGYARDGGPPEQPPSGPRLARREDHNPWNDPSPILAFREGGVASA